MIEPAGKPPEGGRFRLRTFGTFSLTGPGDETILGTHGHQHRRLALLSVLAAAGRNGRSRDHLLLLFWPDATQSRARHSLEQLLYAIRSSVSESVFAGVNPVRLNLDVMGSDVGAFNDAIERRDFEAAVYEYRGPFLDGFYLSDSPEFEQWLGTERARLARVYSDALEQLAHAAEAANKPTEAVRWWQKLVESDPVSSKNAEGLMRALMKAGDHAAALKYAEDYQAIVARELGTSVGPGVANLVSEARARTAERVADRPPLAEESHQRQDPAAPIQEAIVDVRSPVPAPVEKSRRWSPWVAVAAVVMMAGVLLWPIMKTAESAGASGSTPSIAVMPLSNVGGSSEDSSFVDGLSEELMGALDRIENLRVISRTSAFAFQGSKLDVRKIADSLGVSNILEGSVQRSGARLRVQVRLVDASDGSTRWSETFDRELVDVFAVQSEIAASIARQLDLRLSARSAQEIREGLTRSIAAYDLYLRGRDPVHFRSPSDSARLIALGYLRDAVELDPTFAAAYATMPYWYISLSSSASEDSVQKLIRSADSTAQLALRLDPALPESHVGMGVSQILGMRNLPLAEREFRRALELGGAPRVREHLANVLLWTGRYEEALAENVRAAADDPLSPTAASDLGRSLCLNGRYAEGMARLSGLSRLQPPLRRTKGHVALCHAMKGAWKEAAALMRDAADPRGHGYLGYYLARAGDTTEARRVQAGIIEYWEQHKRGAIAAAIVAAGLGDYDSAFEWLGRAESDRWLRGDLMYPVFADLHRDPRFPAMARQLGFQIR